jgi:hypothetical protein
MELTDRNLSIKNRTKHQKVFNSQDIVNSIRRKEKTGMIKKIEKFLGISFISMILLSMATINVTPVFANPTRIYVNPPSKIDPTLTPPKTFNLTIIIENVSNFVGYEIQIYWERAILNVTSAVETPPAIWSVFKSGPGVQWNYNTTHGRYYKAIMDASSPIKPASGTFTVLTLTFKVMGIGSCPIELRETILSDPVGDPITHTAESGYFNNISPAKLYVNPMSIINPDLVPCHNFSVDIKVQNAINLYSWEFKLYYKNDILNGTGVTEGPFLMSSGPTVFQIIQFTDSFNATHGIVWVTCTLLAPPPVSGNGTLATISFHVEGLGDTVLDLADTSLKDPSDVPIPHFVFDGYFNNVLKAHLFVDPPSIINPALLPPAYFNVSIKIANVTNLYAYEFKLGYNTAILNCLGVIIIPFDNETNFIVEMHMEDSLGLLRVNVTYYPPADPLTTTEPKTLALIFFQIANVGSSVLDLHDTRLVDSSGMEIPHDVSDGFISILRHDVAVIDVVAYTDVVPYINETYQGWSAFVNVTVENQGDAAETFTVKAYYDNHLIGTATVTNLAPNATSLIAFSWNTAGVPPCHFYAIKANATIVPYETDITDNELADGTIKIRLFADINADKVVNLLDLVLAAGAFGARPGYPNWNPWADLVRDNVINIFDLVKCSLNFGKSC